MFSFHDLAWTPPTTEHKKGIIAGALDDGILALWDAEKLETDPENASIYSKKVHSGAIKTLQYNPHPKFSHYLATGGAKGELFIVDLSDLDSDPIRLGSTAARADEIDCLDWNKKVPNILVTGSSGGFVTVWDLKTKKESLTLNNFGRKAVSAVAWDPEKPTRLITAVPLEQEAVILVWDLRNSNAPEKVMRGHDSGVLSLSWCPQDNDLLLSCGKDNRTLLWNPQTGQSYGEYPVVTNWTFQTRWNPKNPSMFATASFDGKILIQTLQSTNPQEGTQQEQTTAGDGEDFFSRAQTQPQTSSFSLQKAPKWLERPCSVSFGFGGRVISVRQAEPGKRTSKVSITKFEVDSDVGAATNTFEEAMQSGNLDELCDTRAADAKTDEEKADWQVMKTMLSKKPREELVKYLGFDETNEVADSLAKAGLEDKSDENDKLKPQVNGAGKGHKRFESVFATDADGDFLSQLAATKGTTTNNPFQIFTGSETEADKQITKLVMLGKFDKALDICLAEGRMSDAFMLAICGGEACIKKTQEAYFAKQGDGPNYLRLLASVVGKNLWDTVHNADLENWKGIMATLCTFADEKEFPDLCEALGDRLDAQTEHTAAARKDAAFCYLAGSKLEKVIDIWISELKEHEEEGAAKAAESSAFSLHAKALQDLIEKVTIFRKVVDFQDTELQKTGEWKLEALYNKYLEYADIVAAHGQLEAASKYLALLPMQYPEADVARARIQQATKKPVVPAARQPASEAATPQKPLPGRGYQQQPASTFSPVAPPVPTPFAQQASTPAATSSYAPPGAQSYASPNAYQPAQATARPSNPYAPAGGAGGYQPPQPMRAAVAPPPQMGGLHQAPSSFGAPPRNLNQSPAVAPPSQAKDMKAWNDLPDDFARAPTPRRGTPSVAPQQQFGAQPANQFFGQSTPPGSSGTSFGSRPQKAVPPPPKAGEIPTQRVQSPQTSGTEIRRPSSTAQNAYAPPQQPPGSSLPTPMQPPVARGPSPFTAPPSGAPPPNRYAPAPGSQQTTNAPPTQRIISPPPQAGQFQSSRTPSNPYAPGMPQGQPPSNPYAPAPPQQQFNQPPPQQGGPPPRGPPPAQREAGRPSTVSPPPAAAPTAKKHPKGDRSHIPSEALPIYQILGAEMSRIEPRAPSTFAPQVRDTAKRLDILYDHLNNQDLIKEDTVGQLVDLANCIQSRDYIRAEEIRSDIHVNKVEECGQWMVGVKRLISMGKAIQH